MPEIFIAACDETKAVERTLIYGGFVAPRTDWNEFFEPAWREQVLAVHPKLSSLHAVEWYDRDWLKERGVPESAAYHALNGAARVIQCSGFLRLRTCRVDQPHFDEHFGKTRIVREQSRQPAVDRLKADAFAFLGFAFQALGFVHAEYPEVERVDFLVEKSPVTEDLRRLHDTLAASLDAVDEAHLSRLVGEFRHGGKDSPLLQAADFACWHVQRRTVGFRSRIEAARYWAIAGRIGTDHQWDQDDVEASARRAVQQGVSSPFPPKKPRPG